MAIPYAFLKVLNKEEPYLERHGRSLREQKEYLKGSRNMGELYLGACLDSIRWGGQTSVMYEMTIPEMVSFIDFCMKQNSDKFEKLFHEKKIEEMSTHFELPYIEHDSCPRDEVHKGR